MHLFANSFAVNKGKKKKTQNNHFFLFLLCFVLEEAEKNPVVSGTAKVC